MTTVSTRIKDIQKQIEAITASSRKFNTCDPTNGDVLVELLKDITTRLFYLETVRAKVHDEFQRKIYDLTSDGTAVNRAENEAHVEYPEMYLLRRVLDSGYKVADSIRTHISYLKFEKQHSNHTT